VAFIAEAVERRAGARLFASSAYAKYAASCADACSEEVFTAAMRDAGFPRATYHGLEHYVDAVLRGTAREPDPAGTAVVVVPPPTGSSASEGAHDCAKSRWSKDGSGDWRCCDCGAVDPSMRDPEEV
jgi:hypothetical protein